MGSAKGRERANDLHHALAQVQAIQARAQCDTHRDASQHEVHQVLLLKGLLLEGLQQRLDSRAALRGQDAQLAFVRAESWKQQAAPQQQQHAVGVYEDLAPASALEALVWASAAATLALPHRRPPPP